jgi:ribose 5-phosphate isomerase
MEETKTPRLFEILGGRKMTLTWVAMLLGTAIEIGTERGISETFAMFLAGAVASFSAANVVTTFRALGVESKPQVSPEAIDGSPAITDLTNAVVQLKGELDESKAETKRELEAGAQAVHTMASTIENMRKVIVAISKGQKVS